MGYRISGNLEVLQYECAIAHKFSVSSNSCTELKMFAKEPFYYYAETYLIYFFRNNRRTGFVDQ